MKNTNTCLLAAFIAGAIQGWCPAQSPMESAPLYHVTVVQGTAQAINYRRLLGGTKIGLQGTILVPNASGIAYIQNREGVVEVDADFEDLPPASTFGLEYLTYVLWAISPEGRPTNLGELVLDGTSGSLKVTTQLQAFGLVLTAEPYFAVTQMSDVVVMENKVRRDTVGKIEPIDAHYELMPRGEYTLHANPSDLQPVKLDPKMPLDLYEARNAVKIAKLGGADAFATDVFNKAQQLLQQAEEDQFSKKNRKLVVATAREAAQTAEDARLIAVKHQGEEHQAQEQMKATQQVAEAKTQTQLAEMDARAASQQATQAQIEAQKAKLETLQASDEKAQLRTQLMQQLNQIIETRDTTRGLIINMSDVLFETGKSELLPPFREKLAKIAGIALAHPGLKAEVDGYTDNVGSEEYNQRLSESRAASVRDYLTSQGLSSTAVTAKGFGKTQPVASNNTPEGRQKNRRVELVVSGDILGSNIGTAATRQH